MNGQRTSVSVTCLLLTWVVVASSCPRAFDWDQAVDTNPANSNKLIPAIRNLNDVIISPLGLLQLFGNCFEVTRQYFVQNHHRTFKVWLANLIVS